ncbi:MAG: hypothetical protein V4736_11540 [Bdellovibrionota bacterium]
MIFMGGAGEDSESGIPGNEINQFDQDFEIAKAKAKSSGYTFDYLYAGDHKGSDNFLSKYNDIQYSKSKWMTPFNLDKMIERYQGALNGTNTRPEEQLKAGDQVVFTISNHGMLRGDNPQLKDKEKTHSIACSANQPIEIGGRKNLYCSLDKLQPLIEQMEAKGIKVAVVDESCYGASTLSIGTPKTCVVSKSAQDQVGWNYDKSTFIRHLQPGKSVQDSFQSYIQYSHLNFPMINTQAGQRAAERIRDIVEVRKNDQADLLVRQRCDPQVDPLPRAMRNMMDLTVATNTGELPNTPEMQQALNDLGSALKQYQEKSDEAIRYLKLIDLAKSKSSKDRENAAKAIHLYNRLTRMPDDLTRADENTIVTAALNIDRPLKAIYDLLYKEELKKERAPSACAQFTF